jgi:hypothetical protein
MVPCPLFDGEPHEAQVEMYSQWIWIERVSLDVYLTLCLFLWMLPCGLLGREEVVVGLLVVCQEQCSCVPT